MNHPPFYYYMYIQNLFDKELNKKLEYQNFTGYVYSLVLNDNINYIGSTSKHYDERYSEHIHMAYEQIYPETTKHYRYYRTNKSKEDFIMKVLIKHNFKTFLQLTLLEDAFIDFYKLDTLLNSKINHKTINNIILSNTQHKKKLIKKNILETLDKCSTKLHISYITVKLNKIFIEEQLNNDSNSWCITDTSYKLPKSIYNIKPFKPLTITETTVESLHTNIYGLYLVKIKDYVRYFVLNGGFNNITNTTLIEQINNSNITDIQIIPIEYYYVQYDVLKNCDFLDRLFYVKKHIGDNVNTFIKNPISLYSQLYPLYLLKHIQLPSKKIAIDTSNIDIQLNPKTKHISIDTSNIDIQLEQPTINIDTSVTTNIKSNNKTLIIDTSNVNIRELTNKRKIIKIIT